MYNIFKGMKEAIDWVREPHKIEDLFTEISQNTWLEITETGDMFHILWRLSCGEEITKEESEVALEQAKDLARTIPAFGIFMLPGGSILLPIVAKIIPWDILPSSFRKKS